MAKSKVVKAFFVVAYAVYMKTDKVLFVLLFERKKNCTTTQKSKVICNKILSWTNYLEKKS